MYSFPCSSHFIFQLVKKKTNKRKQINKKIKTKDEKMRMLLVQALVPGFCR